MARGPQSTKQKGPCRSKPRRNRKNRLRRGLNQASNKDDSVEQQRRRAKNAAPIASKSSNKHIVVAALIAFK